MNRTYIFILFLISIVIAGFSQDSGNKITSPIEFFGFQPGTDRLLFDYEQLIDYLKIIESQSGKVKLKEIGTSPEGRSMYIAFISSEENITKLTELKKINRELALNSTLNEKQRKLYIDEGKVFILATLSMHSNEVGPSQAAPLMAYHLISAKGKDTTTWLNNTVFMMVPCHNPDGMNMVVNHYKKYKGTKYDGSSMPGIYHKYVGHDNNRDFVTLTQDDTRAIAAIYNKNWYPQVMVEKHQMWSSGVRYFVPPMHDPIAENIDESVWNWTWVFGSNMVKDMTKLGQAGVSQHYLFDDYWPGSTETCLWKGVVGMLTEAASVQYAKPVYIEPNEIRVIGKGLSEHKKSINLSLPWQGGWWKLSDIVDYELSSMYSIIKTSSLHKVEILTFRNDLCKKEVYKGRTEPPYYYVLPAKQHDHSELSGLLDLLDEHGVEIYKSKIDIVLDEKVIEKGDFVVPLAQPFRAFIKEAMEKQNFPVRHYTPGGQMVKPYDITSWSLPLHRGVKSLEINKFSGKLDNGMEKVDFPIKYSVNIPTTFEAVILDVKENSSFKIAFKALTEGKKIARLEKDYFKISRGSFMLFKETIENPEIKKLISGLPFQPLFINNIDTISYKTKKMPSIGFVETWFHDMDAGWTRFIFDEYNIPYKVIRPADFKEAKALNDIDVLIFPDADKNVLMEGKMKRNNSYYISGYPPEYTKGIGKGGLNNILNFLNNGGNIISWRRSVDIFTGLLTIKEGNEVVEEFQLPFSNISQSAKKEKFYCPGSLLRVHLKQDHPLTYGLPESVGVFARSEPVLSTSVPIFDMDRRVIGTFPEREIVISGYAENEKVLAGKPAMVWIKKGKGQMILFSFYPQFRSSTTGTYKLLFNAILLP